MTTNTDTTAASGAASQPNLQTVVKYLCGEGPLCGVWFGDGVPAGDEGSFWWRRYLRAALAAPAAQEAEPAGYRISDPEEPEIGSWFSETPARAKYGLLSVPLYAHPPRPQAPAAGAAPTDAEIDDLCREISDYDDPKYFRYMVRAVLARWGAAAPAQDLETEREAFEAWYRKTQGDRAMLWDQAYGDLTPETMKGKYILKEEQSAWAAWQAARARQEGGAAC